MSNHCHEDHEDAKPTENSSAGHNHSSHKKRFDWLLWGSAVLIVLGYGLHLAGLPNFLIFPVAETFTASTFELVNKMWWGVLLGVFFVGLLDRVPREFVMAILGRNGGMGGIVRAAGAGVLLDLCSHGILLVGMKLYERGASLGQVMAFLIASPWNSLSLTLILFALIGLKWTLAILFLSLVIALISGVIFDWLVARGTLPANPNKVEFSADFSFWRDLKFGLKETRFDFDFFTSLLTRGLAGSGMILRWIFFGVVLAGLVRAFVSPEVFGEYFGPTLLGLGFTVLVATILEVCSEGSTPIAADLMTRAGAPGNTFAFLMTGVSTDYTEMLSLKETTKSWKIAFFLPLVTLPQVLLLAWLLNQANF